jgi:hypothetical protein
MKKINLKLVKEFLSRNEMKQVTGGCGGGGNGGGGGGGGCWVMCSNGIQVSTVSCNFADIACSWQGWTICTC